MFLHWMTDLATNKFGNRHTIGRTTYRILQIEIMNQDEDELTANTGSGIMNGIRSDHIAEVSPDAPKLIWKAGLQEIIGGIATEYENQMTQESSQASAEKPNQRVPSSKQKSKTNADRPQSRSPTPGPSGRLTRQTHVERREREEEHKSASNQIHRLEIVSKVQGQADMNQADSHLMQSIAECLLYLSLSSSSLNLTSITIIPPLYFQSRDLKDDPRYLPLIEALLGAFGPP
jgi:hypothetical protein